MRRLDEMYRARDIRGLAGVLFKRKLYPGQADIARLTAFFEQPRAAVCCYTQYGKTFGIGTGLAVDLVMDPLPRKIALVGPRAEQARLIRGEFLGAALKSPVGRSMLGLTRKGADRMISKRVNLFQTKHGKEYKVLTTGKNEDAGEALMGHGVDSTPAPPGEDGEELEFVEDQAPASAGVVVVTEAGLIPPPAWPKITRMLGDRGILIAEGNPWEKGTGFHKLWEAATTHRIHIDWRQGVREGRIRAARVEEERASMPPLFFTVLYDSLFPDTAEDQLIAWQHVQAAQQPQGPLGGRVERRYGLDVAEGGVDLTVLTPLDVGHAYGKEQYRVGQPEAWNDEDPLKLADLVAPRMRPGSIVVVDAIGPGSGVASALRRKGFQVRAFKAGESAREKDKYRNMGSEGYWLLRLAFQERRIQIPSDARLVAQLTQPKWYSDDKRVIVDKKPNGAKSPDYADSLMMAVHGGDAQRKIIVR